MNLPETGGEEILGGCSPSASFAVQCASTHFSSFSSRPPDESTDTHMRRFSVLAASTLLAGLIVVVGAGPASATTTITNPPSDPASIPGDAQHNPLPITVVASGYTPGGNIFVTQCDG